jgi:hypothetical protein
MAAVAIDIISFLKWGRVWGISSYGTTIPGIFPKIFRVNILMSVHASANE